MSKTDIICALAKLPIGFDFATDAAIQNGVLKHTEKPFPGFKLELYAQHEVENYQAPDTITVGPWCDGSGPVQIDYVDPDGNEVSIMVAKSKFKEFTEGCNEIVKWLEEQE